MLWTRSTDIALHGKHLSRELVRNVPNPAPGAPLSTEDWARWWKDAGGWQLRQILFWRWDPIGVQEGFPWSYDEYDSYAGLLAKTLREGATKEEVAHRLEEFELEIGLSVPPEAEVPRLALAGFIEMWFPASIEHWKSRRA